MASTAVRVAAVRRQLAAGDVDTLRTLAERVRADGIEASADELRTDLRRLGAVRVEGPDGPRLAIPVAKDGTSGASSVLPAELVADPDWPLHLAVAVVVAVFLVIGVAGWLIAP